MAEEIASKVQVAEGSTVPGVPVGRLFPFERLRIRSVRFPLVATATAVVTLAIAFAVYNATLTPGLSYESLDGNELATVPYQLGLAHATGYPFYIWIGKLFTFLPIGDVAHRMNLMSAVGAAGGAALLFFIIWLVVERGSPRGIEGRSRPLVLVAAAAGALLFSFSTTIWSQAVIAEVYAPNVFMLALTLLLLLLWARREERRGAPRDADARSLGLFGLFAFVFGLSLGTHMSNLAFAPAFLLFIVLTNWRVLLEPRLIAAGVLGFGLGALQFAWLPYKAGQADNGGGAIAFSAPDDLRGIYNYTLNAFPQLKWAFPWSAMPDRIILYFRLVLDNFGWYGAALAVLGGWVMALRYPKVFFLFAAAYVFETIFFLQYAATDIDVFFIPAHLILAIAAACGGFFLIEAVARYGRRLSSAGVAVPALAAVVIAAMPVVSLAQHWGDNDQSKNTSINDFYNAVFEELPQNSVLLGQSGVFGYDMFYFRYVYNVRPDVAMPTAPTAGEGAAGVTSDRPTFTTTASFGGRGFGGFGRAGNGAPADAWYVPVVAAPGPNGQNLFGGGRLTLYRVETEVPQLFTTSAAPANRLDYDFGSLTLVGYDIDSRDVAAGGTVHLTLYWSGDWTGNYSVSTREGDSPYTESHQLGFGNVSRYIQEFGEPPSGSVLAEDYDLVVLSSLGGGEQPLYIRVSSGQGASDWLQLTTLTVTR
jgi:hypothetical protein